MPIIQYDDPTIAYDFAGVTYDGELIPIAVGQGGGGGGGDPWNPSQVVRKMPLPGEITPDRKKRKKMQDIMLALHYMRS